MKWTRTPEGLESGRYRIERHEVDDRADHGERWTYWHLVIDGHPFEVYSFQRDARHAAEWWAGRREVLPPPGPGSLGRSS